MEQLCREVEEKREAEAEQQHEEKIRQIRELCAERVEQYIQRENKLHLETLKKIEEGQKAFMNTVNEIKEAEALEHEKRKAEILEEMKFKLAAVSKKCDYVTQAALDNLESGIEKVREEIRQLETENISLLKRNINFEIQLEQRVFAEVNKIKSEDEEEARKYAEAISQLIADQLEEKQTMLAEERAVMEKNAAEIIAEVEDDLIEQERIGNLNLAIQQSAEEAKNRRLINTKIMEVKYSLQDLEESYEKVIGVLDASPENYEKFTPQAKRTTNKKLTRFSEILNNINRNLNEIEKNLATFKLANVDTEMIIRAIKTQISSFSEIISALKTILSLDVPMDEAKSKDFTFAKEELMKQINEMELIKENKGELSQCIGNLHDLLYL